LEDNYKQIQSENYSLREYIIHLQSRLIDNGDQAIPQPPPNVNLGHPQQRMEIHGRDGAPVAPMAPMSQLQASAARALATAGKHESHGYGQTDQHKRFKDSTDDSATADDLIRSQLTGGADGLPTSMSM
jgi:hypothetical protein